MIQTTASMLDITQGMLDNVCTANKLYPVYNTLNAFVNRFGFVYTATVSDDWVLNFVKLSPDHYTKKKQIPVYKLIHYKTGLLEEMKLTDIILHTFYGPLMSDYDVEILYSPGDTIEYESVRYKIDYMDLGEDDNHCININGEPFKNIMFDGLHKTQYYISQHGVVYNILRNSFIPHSFQHNLYHRVALSMGHGKPQKRFEVHRLVYNVWTNQSPWLSEDIQINHIDGMKFNNDLPNLEAVTSMENFRHAVSTNLRGNVNSAHRNRMRNYAGQRHMQFTDDEIRQVCELIQSDLYTPKEIAEILGKDHEKVRTLIKVLIKGSGHVDIASNYDFTKYASRTHNTKIPDEIVHRIFRLHIDENKSRREISDITNIGYSTVTQILGGRVRKDIYSQYQSQMN